MTDGKRVLVIDDQANILGAVAEVFDAIGLQFLGAEDGETGIQIARDEQPDLIVCDYYMNGLDGLEVFQRLRQNHETASIPFVLMTMDDSLEERAKKAGVNGFMTKGTGDLVMTVMQFLA